MIFCATCKYYHGAEEIGTCLAPLPYWIMIDRSVLGVSCAGNYKTAKKCMCYAKKGETQDATEED